MGNFKFFIKDFGCRINQYDSRIISKNLKGMGNKYSSLHDSDIVIVNTCSVTRRAAQNSFKYIRKIENNYPDKEVLVVGCTARSDEVEFNKKKVKVHGQFLYLDNPNITLKRFYGHNRAFMKVQQGCNWNCSYCIVKNLKKPFFKKSINNIIDEIKELAELHSEVVLCATNFDEYGELLFLVKEIKRLKENIRWRFGSITVNALTREVIAEIADDEKFCRHFHIPLQSGSDEMLRMMNRSYSLQDAIISLENVIAEFKEVTFSFDIIVGFPGETETMFIDTLMLIKKFNPIKVHVFRYSDRPSTDAYYINEKTPEVIKKVRLDKVVEVSEKIKQKHFADSLGNSFELVLEDHNTGYTRNYLPVKVEFPGFYNDPGSIINVRISGFNDKYIIGEPL